MEVFKMNIDSFEVMSEQEMGIVEGGGYSRVAPGIYCKDVHGRAKCTTNQKELWGYTGRVIVNGWINYGPWAKRPGIGVIIP